MDASTTHPEPVAAERIGTEEVAALCGVKPGTVASWRSPARAQPLAFYRIGGRCSYLKADVLAFIEAGRRELA